MSSEKLVGDLMHTLDRYHSIREEGKVADAVRLMYRAEEEGRPSCLLVVGEDAPRERVIKGFVTASEIVFGVTSHFLEAARQNGPIFWEGQLEEESRDGAAKRVADIMTPIQGCVRQSEMIMQAIFLMKKHRVRFLPVVRKEEVTGMIHLEDILKEIARMTL